MFKTIDTKVCILVYTILLLCLFDNQLLAATKEDDKLNAFIIGKASVLFKGCNNTTELISSGLTVVLQNSLEDEDILVEKEIAIETDQKGFFVSELVYPRLSSVKEVKFKDHWQIPLSAAEGPEVSYDVTEKGMCKKQGMAITFMEISLSVGSDCNFKHSTNIFFGPNNEVAELLFHTILSLPEQEEFTRDLKGCLDDIMEKRNGMNEN